LEAPLPVLRCLAAGSLGRAVATTDVTIRNGRTRMMLGRIYVQGQEVRPDPKHLERAACSSLITSSLVTQLMSPELVLVQTEASRKQAALVAPVDLTPPPLTHLVLAYCAEFQVLPRLPSTLRHLDLRGANVQVPEAALNRWQPLANCIHLEVLNLAATSLLSSRALLVCIASLPSRTQLKVLDISETQAEASLFEALPSTAQALTHFRSANCSRLVNDSLADIMFNLKHLEVLDVTGCSALVYPFLESVPPYLAGLRQSRKAEKLRLFGVGRTLLAEAHLDSTRRCLLEVAPQAEVIPTMMDLFQGYTSFPPRLL
jgi:hypothetical protein